MDNPLLMAPAQVNQCPPTVWAGRKFGHGDSNLHFSDVNQKKHKVSPTIFCFLLCFFWIYFAKACCILKLHLLKNYIEPKWVQRMTASWSCFLTSWSSARKKRWENTFAVSFHSLSVFMCLAAHRKHMLVWQRIKHIPQQIRTNMFHPKQHHPQSACCVFTCKPSIAC